MKKLDWFDDKRLLAMIREGDYAHAGEAAAIDYVFSSIAKDKNRQLLDVGCGLGGTAEYIQQHDFGVVTGIDIDSDAIAYAKKQYPKIEFYVEDAVNIDKSLPHKKYDVIYSLNSFFAFSDKLRVLKNLTLLAKPKAQLIIFDYIDFSEDNKITAIKNDILETTFAPIHLGELKNMMKKTQWEIKKIENLEHQFIAWYKELLAKIMLRKENIIAKFNEDAYLKVVSTFTGLYNALNDKTIGGGIIYAEL